MHIQVQKFDSSSRYHALRAGTKRVSDGMSTSYLSANTTAQEKEGRRAEECYVSQADEPSVLGHLM